MSYTSNYGSIPTNNDTSYVLLMLALGTLKRNIPEMVSSNTLSSEAEDAMLAIGVKAIEGSATPQDYVSKLEAIVKKEFNKSIKFDDHTIAHIVGRIELTKTSTPKNLTLDKATDKSIKHDGTMKPMIKEGIESDPRFLALPEADKTQVQVKLHSMGLVKAFNEPVTTQKLDFLIKRLKKDYKTYSPKGQYFIKRLLTTLDPKDWKQFKNDPVVQDYQLNSADSVGTQKFAPESGPGNIQAVIKNGGRVWYKGRELYSIHSFSGVAFIWFKAETIPQEADVSLSLGKAFERELVNFTYTPKESELNEEIKEGLDVITAVWWDNEHPFDKIALARKYFPGRHYSEISDSDIEFICSKETPYIKEVATLEEAGGKWVPKISEYLASHGGATVKNIFQGIGGRGDASQGFTLAMYRMLHRGLIRRDDSKRPFKYFMAANPGPKPSKGGPIKTAMDAKASKWVGKPEAPVAKSDNPIINVLNKKPGITFAELLHSLGVVPKSAQQIKVFTMLKAALLSGSVRREKDGLSFKYYVGDGTPTVMKTINRQPKAAKVPASQKKKEVILATIEGDAKRFRPGDSPDEVTKDSDSVSISFRHLGNWEDDEDSAYEHENPDDDGYDPNWREDNDNRIWARGEYKKYAQMFKDWAKGYPWRKYVDLSLTTSEKDWCEFTITLKKKDQKPYSSI